MQTFNTKVKMSGLIKSLIYHTDSMKVKYNYDHKILLNVRADQMRPAIIASAG